MQRRELAVANRRRMAASSEYRPGRYLRACLLAGARPRPAASAIAIRSASCSASSVLMTIAIEPVILAVGRVAFDLVLHRQILIRIAAMP